MDLIDESDAVNIVWSASEINWNDLISNEKENYWLSKARFTAQK